MINAHANAVAGTEDRGDEVEPTVLVKVAYRHVSWKVVAPILDLDSILESPVGIAVEDEGPVSVRDCGWRDDIQIAIPVEVGNAHTPSRAEHAVIASRNVIPLPCVQHHVNGRFTELAGCGHDVWLAVSVNISDPMAVRRPSDAPLSLVREVPRTVVGINGDLVGEIVRYGNIKMPVTVHIGRLDADLIFTGEVG